MRRRRGRHIGFLWESQKDNRLLGRPLLYLGDNIEMDLGEIGWD
jgi:hypothetical protein